MHVVLVMGVVLCVSLPTTLCYDCSNVEKVTASWNYGRGRNGFWRFDRQDKSVTKVEIIVTFTKGYTSGPNMWTLGCPIQSRRIAPNKLRIIYQKFYSWCTKDGLFFIGYSSLLRNPRQGSGLTKSFTVNGVEQCRDGKGGTTTTTSTPVKKSSTTASTTSTTMKTTTAKTTTLPPSKKTTTTTIATSSTTTTEEATTTKPTQRPTTAKPTETPVTIKSTTTPETTQDPSTCKTKHNYAEVLSKSILFYKAQRSGKLPDNDIPWRRDSFTKDRTEEGVSLSGGYFDAGDYVKFNFPAAAATTVLAWGLVDFAEGYKFAGLYDEGLKTLKWATDYFMKCHTGKNELYGQCGIGSEDHSFWGRPEEYYARNPQFKNPRPCMKIDQNNPGSDLAGETAAALAATSIAYKKYNAAYSKQLLNHAKELYAFANSYRKMYSDSIKDAAAYYRSWSGFFDELGWAAAWLFKATGEQHYLNDAESHWNRMGKYPNEFSWDNKARGVAILLAQLSKNPTQYKSNADKFCQHMKLSQQRTSERNLVFIQQWGSNRHAANVAFICLAHSKASDGTFNSFGREQIDLLLGDKAKGLRSYVIGYGHNPPQRPHHTSSSCPDYPKVCDWHVFREPGPNHHVLNGALVGGVKSRDGQYVDDRTDYVMNEVSLDYNAGFQSALAALLQLQKNGQCGK